MAVHRVPDLKKGTFWDEDKARLWMGDTQDLAKSAGPLIKAPVFTQELITFPAHCEEKNGSSRVDRVSILSHKYWTPSGLLENQR